MLRDYDEGYKVIIAGSSGVGKSSLLLRFVDNYFSENLLSTIGVDFKFKTFDIRGKKIKMQIWDTAGSEAFRSIVSAYYRGANAVVLVYAIDDKVSFQEMTNFWIQEVLKHKEEDCEIMLLANKSDVPIDAVSEAEVQKFMSEYKISLFKEVSARTGSQVGEAFKVLGEKLMSKGRKKEDKEKISLEREMSHPDVPEGSKKKKCCG
jgi:Ras-related protein Rab-1A